VAAAKVQIGKSGKFVGQQSIQLHGGIGMTQEAKIGHYFKRLTMIENTFGDTDYHMRRVSEAGGVLVFFPRPFEGGQRGKKPVFRECGAMDCFARNDDRNKQRAKTKMKNTPFDLTGRVAIITGSSRGIGRSSAELLAKLGAKVVISSRKADACKEVADGITKAG